MVTNCREARRAFTAPENGLESVQRHLGSCSRCAVQYRLFRLERAVLDAAAAEQPAPSEEFFSALRSRIAREPRELQQISGWPEDSWPALMWVTARQLIPVMTMILISIIGMTLLWDAPAGDSPTISSRDRLLFNEVYEYPQPTTDDVLESLVALEDKQDGR